MSSPAASQGSMANGGGTETSSFPGLRSETARMLVIGLTSMLKTQANCTSNCLIGISEASLEASPSRSHWHPQPSGSSSRGPGPCSPSLSHGLRSGQTSSDRHPHPMHPSSWSRRRVSRLMRSSRATLQRVESALQSSVFGVRLSGSVANASRISESGIPVRCATLMTATRRSTSRA